MTDRRLAPRNFIADKPLVAAKARTINGKDLQPGDLIDADLPTATLMRLWMTGLAVYEDVFRPTPVAEPSEGEEEQVDPNAWKIRADGVDVTEGDNGWYVLKADWTDEAEKVRGHEAAEARVAELRATPEYARGGVAIDETGGGWYQITAPWLAEPVKVQGADKAHEKAMEILADKGKTPPAE